MSSTAAAGHTVDLRCLGNCTDRKAHVLATFDTLAAGEGLVVLNDHMPNGLRRHLEELRPGAFAWAALEAGPEVFRVEITRIA
jgi:uncharacterized protein (DUF2249 family)